jgi:outer membrane protein OmpA-like peptidoglycan-associated protein
MHAISRATYRQVAAAKTDSFQIMAIETRQGGGILAGLGGGRPTPVRWKGILSLASPSPVPFPVMVNGQRVTVPALHLRGQLVFRDRKWTPEFWILADSAYPLLLKWVGAANEPTNILQTTRIEFPSSTVEAQLTKECRAELPGIYFAFNSAVLDSTSNRSIASVADMLGRHADWSLTLEGHTDNIGSAASNRTLSERRVATVKARLVTVHRIADNRLRAAGFGSERPREPNTTIEGRARNRRVELVRECKGQ